MPATTEPARLFTPEEINAVLAQYELGVVSSVREMFAGGSGSPKALIECARGKFVLKRRARGSDNPFRVAYAHEIMLHLRARGFDAAPALVGTRGENNSMVQLEGSVYELFVFVEGRPFARTPEQARGAGAALARVHALLDRFTPRQPHPPERADTMTLIARAADAIRAGALGRELAALVEAAGPPVADDTTDPPGLIHGDYHPGNLLFHKDAVAGVFDFDSARHARRSDDVAQGLVQFSMRRAGAGPDEWPSEPDSDLATSFLAGYSGDGARMTLPPSAAPACMIRSLAAEWAEGAIAGTLGGVEGAARLLGAVIRKSRWLAEHGTAFSRALTPPE